MAKVAGSKVSIQLGHGGGLRQQRGLVVEVQHGGGVFGPLHVTSHPEKMVGSSRKHQAILPMAENTEHAGACRGVVASPQALRA